MTQDEDIAALIEALAEARGWTRSYAAFKASGSADTLERLAAGSSITLRRANAILRRVDELWPDDAPWPVGPIVRPDKAA